ncbi:MAG: low affinity iron permease family protein, partial [Mycobacteriales bacterium]
LIVVIWVPSFFVIGSLDTWQLIINTATTIVTFLMVSLLQNTQSRADAAVQDKLNAIARGLSDLMHVSKKHNPELEKALNELHAAIGVEDREST